MAPRALTEQEKHLQKKKILENAERLVMQYGVKRVSLDDIVQAAGIGKATFYRFWGSKEAMLLELIWDINQEILDDATQLLQESPRHELRQRVRAFLLTFIRDRNMMFFLINHQELEGLVASMNAEEVRDFGQMEYEAFERLIRLAGLDPEKVRPGVVHNYIHVMYFASSDSAILRDDREETIEVIVNGLLDYMFGPEAPETHS